MTNKVVRIARDWIESRESLAFMLKDLARSALTDKDMAVEPGRWRFAPGVPAYRILYPDSNYWRMRFDRVDAKYIGPKETMPEVYFPKGVDRKKYRAATTKYVCEGEKKAVAFFKATGLPVCGIGGCWMWRMPKTGTMHPQLQDNIKTGDTIVYIADRDIMDPNKSQVAQAAKSFQGSTQVLNCAFSCMVPPAPFKGIDDWLVAGHTDLEALEELDLDLYGRVPPLEMKRRGMTYTPNKDGELVSAKQLLPNYDNSYIAMEILYGGTKLIGMDKYKGFSYNGDPMDADSMLGQVLRNINTSFPGFKFDDRAIWEYLKTLELEPNCVQRYVASLKWDGVKRLSDWGSKVFEWDTDDKDKKAHCQKLTSMLMCALYARIMEPGCQMDHMFILTGPQGIGKTTFFRILGAFPDHDGYFMVTTEEIMETDYTAKLKRKTAIVLDHDDLEATSRKERGNIKSFIVQTHDDYRVIYSKATTKEPRGFILTGSSNNSEILHDVTGNRRFLVMPVLKVKDWNHDLRDQLLAEVHEFWPKLSQEWWKIDLDVLADMNMEHKINTPVMQAIEDMHEEGRLLKVNTTPCISAWAIKKWIGDDDPRLTVDAIGRQLSQLHRSRIMKGLTLGKRTQIRTKHIDEASEVIRRLYMPQNKVDKAWVYPVLKTT